MDIINIVFTIITIAIPVILGAFFAITIMAILLNKSNNLGATGKVSPSVQGNICIYDRFDGNDSCSLHEDIRNPVILAHMDVDNTESYSSKNANLSLEDQIDSADFGNIKWHT
ncbi:MAG: hypothetical protein MJ108_09725 [Saccharofermentans sp.]|nr:hypothetical protein [Saccharofermentans sp.]